MASPPQGENCTLAIVSHRRPRIHEQSDVSIKKDVELLSRCFRTIHSAIRTSRAFPLDNARLKIMQSVFRSAARRRISEEREKLERRGGELKTGWTEPHHDRSAYGF